MLGWADDNFNNDGAEQRTVDQKGRAVGIFGDVLEAHEHGHFVQWEAKSTGYVLKPVISDGQLLVPKPVMIMEYILKMAVVAESDRKGESGRVRLLPETMPISCALRRRIFWCNFFSDPIFFRRALV